MNEERKKKIMEKSTKVSTFFMRVQTIKKQEKYEKNMCVCSVCTLFEFKRIEMGKNKKRLL